jgi:hypothetical protein
LRRDWETFFFGTAMGYSRRRAGDVYVGLLTKNGALLKQNQPVPQA